MSMDQRARSRTIVLAVLTVAAIFFLLSQEGEKRGRTAANSASRVGVLSVSAPAVRKSPNLLLRLKNFDDRKYANLFSAPWSRNPFAGGEASSGGPRVVAPAAASVSLEGVVFMDDRSFAIINGRSLKRGDRIGPFTIESISRDRVVLAGPGGREVVKMKGAAE